jgi:mono/diheme cytochrome c family protein
MSGMRKDWKHTMTEVWAFVAVAVIAFVGGLLIGDLGSSPKTETVYVASSAEEGGEAAAKEGTEEGEEGEEAAAPEEEGGESGAGAQVFASAGCGSCHALAAAKSTGTTGPDLNESLASDDDTQGIEEMIVKPNAEVIEGYPANVMPQNFGQTLSKTEIHQLAEFLVASTPAKPTG